MAQDLRAKFVSAVCWSGLDVFCRQGLQLFISIALARLLAPREFGTVAMLFLFTAVASSFVEAGFASALIQKQNLTRDEISSVFYFNVAIGFIAACLLCVASPWIAQFYHMPLLKPLTWLMALNLLVGAFGAVQSALLTRELDFRTQMRINVVATLLSGGVAVLLAWHGWGVWSLATQILLSTAVSTTLLWRWRPWRPARQFRLASLRSLFRFGSYLFYSSLLEAAYSRGYTLVIGKLYSPAELGQYSRADSTQQFPASLLSTVLGRVTFPVFCAVSHDDDLLRRGMRKAVMSITLISVPLSLGLSAVARPCVMALYGSAWLACVPYLQVLCLAGALWPLHVLNLNCLLAKGRADLFFRLELWKKLLGIATLLLAANVSILAMAWTQVFLAVVCFFLNAHYTGVLLRYSAWDQLRDIFALLFPTVCMLGAVLLLKRLPLLSPWLLLCLQVGAGALVYACMCSVLKLSAFRDIVAQLKSILPHYVPG